MSYCESTLISFVICSSCQRAQSGLVCVMWMFVECGADLWRLALTGWAAKGSIYMCNLGRWGSQKVLKASLLSCRKMLSSWNSCECSDDTLHSHTVCGMCMSCGWCITDCMLFWADQCWFCGGGTALFSHFLTVPLMYTLSIKYSEVLCPCSRLLPPSFLSFVFSGDRNHSFCRRWQR